MKKRIVSLLFAILFVISPFTLTAFAADSSQDSAVADIYLCSNWSGLPSLGHVWIYIENTSDKSLTVGKYTLPAGEGVSVGTFALTRDDGAGVYYNIEAYCGNKYNMDTFIYLKKSINKSQLDSISNKILSHNFWDPIIFNCAEFAAGCWNAAGGSFIFPVTVFPVFTRIQIKAHSYGSDKKMFYPDRENVYKQRGSGSSAYLEVVSDGSVDSVPG